MVNQSHAGLGRGRNVRNGTHLSVRPHANPGETNAVGSTRRMHMLLRLWYDFLPL